MVAVEAFTAQAPLGAAYWPQDYNISKREPLISPSVSEYPARRKVDANPRGGARGGCLSVQAHNRALWHHGQSP